MTMQARIRELDHRHADLELKIAEELKHPAHDPMQISTLKKQKLQLKQQLAALRLQR